MPVSPEQTERHDKAPATPSHTENWQAHAARDAQDAGKIIFYSAALEHVPGAGTHRTKLARENEAPAKSCWGHPMT